MLGRRWLHLALNVVLLVVGLGLLQVAAERTNRRFDLTPTRDLSLAEKTREVLREIEGPLTITLFYRRGQREQYAGLLKRLEGENAHVRTELLDLDRYPERGRSVGVTQYGRAVLEYAGRRAVVPGAPEDQLVSGILQVVRGRARRLAFTTGHGERSPGGDPENFGRFVSALGAENYAVDPVSLLGEGVPDGADVLIVAGPKRDFLPLELGRIGEYMARGGSILMLLDPYPLPAVATFLATMGIRVGSDVIVDHERRVLGTEGLAAVVEYFREGNPITSAKGNPIESGVVLPSARSVGALDPVPGAHVSTIAQTGTTAWAMADIARAHRGEEPSKAAHDVPGPIPVVVMAELGRGDTARAGRLVVIGDADFASDAYFDLLGNRDLALNSVAWLAVDETLTTTRANDAPEVLRPLSPLVLTAPQARGVLVMAAVVQPALMLLLGAVVVITRRRHG